MPPGPWRVVVVNAWDSRAAGMVDAARAIGARVWLFGLPGKFAPGAWRQSLPYIARRARALGVPGYIVDCENRWEHGHEAEARELAAALRADADAGLSVGVTAFPSMAVIDEIAEVAGRSVFGLIQIYGRTSQRAEDFERWIQRWRGMFSDVVMAIAGWPSSAPLGTPEGYQRYLRDLPEADAYILWTEGRLPQYMRTALESRFGVSIPAGSGASAPRGSSGGGRSRPRLSAGAIVGGSLVALGLAWAVTRGR